MGDEEMVGRSKLGIGYKQNSVEKLSSVSLLWVKKVNLAPQK